MVTQARGTSPQLAQELYNISASLEAKNRNQGRPETGGSPSADYYKGELDAQRQSRVGQTVQKVTGLPGAALSMAARTKNLDQVIGAAVKKAGRTGADASHLTDLLTKVGGMSYLGTTGVLQTSQMKKAAYERQYKPQLGAVGTASSAMTGISMANRALAVPRVAGMMYGGGMPSSLQGSLGMYSAGPQMFGKEALKGATGAAAGGMNMANLATGMAPMLAAQIGLSMMKQKKLARITATRGAGGQEEKKFAWSGQLDSQINMLVSRGQLKPGEQLQITLLKWIESHTSVMPEIWAEQKYIREEKEKGLTGAAQGYEKATGGKDTSLGPVGQFVDFIEGRSAVAGAKYNPFGQLFNFISTGKMPKTFEDELKAAYGIGDDKDQMQKDAKRLGLGMDQHRLMGMSSKQVMDLAPNYETKMLMILGSQFDIARLMASELVTIRQSGFGISETAIKTDNYEKSAIGKLWDAVKGAPGAITNLPGVNALWNIVKAPFTLGSKVRKGVGTGFRKLRTGLLGGDTEEMLTSDEELRKKAGIFKSPQERAYEFVGRGMPDIMEEMRSVGWLQLQEMANIYHVVQAHYNHVSGSIVGRDESYGKNAKKGFWSVTAGKYVNEKGYAEQMQLDEDKMQVALEKSFKGGFTDTILFGLNWAAKQAGVEKTGLESVEDRLKRTTQGLSVVQNLPFQAAAGELGTMGKVLGAPLTGIAQEEMLFTPEEMIQAAQYRQRGVFGRGRGRQDFFDIEYERKIMEMQDLSKQLELMRAEGMGGLISGIGGVGLGLGATALTGGLAAPLMGMAAGGLAGMMPGSMAHLKQQQEAAAVMDRKNKAGAGTAEMYLGIATSGIDIKTAPLGKMRKWFDENVPDPYRKKMGDYSKDAWFEDISKMPYISLALTAIENKKRGIVGGGVAMQPGIGTSAGIELTTSRKYEMGDVYKVLSQARDVEKEALNVRLVGISEEVSKDSGHAIPVYLNQKAGSKYMIGDRDLAKVEAARKGGLNQVQTAAEERQKIIQLFSDVPPSEAVGKDAQGNEVKAAAGGADIFKDGNIRVHKGEKVLTKDDVEALKQSSKIYQAQLKRQKLIDDAMSDKEAVSVGIGGVFGNILLGNWKKASSDAAGSLKYHAEQYGGHRDIKQEMAEVKANQEKKSFWKKIDSIVNSLAGIEENTEGGEKSKNAPKKVGMLKKIAGLLGGAMGALGPFLPLMLPLLLGGLAGGALTGGLGGMALGAGALGLLTAPGLMMKGMGKLAGLGVKGIKGAASWGADKLGMKPGLSKGNLARSTKMGFKQGGTKGALKLGGKSLARTAGRFALPVTLAMGAFDIITDMIAGWKSKEGGGFVGAIKGIFSTTKEGGFMSMLKGSSKYAAMGALIGAPFGGIGAIPGALIGTGIGALMGLLGGDRVKAINDFYKKWTGGKLLAGLFPGKYGSMFADALGNIPIIGPLSGGMIGSVIDTFAGTFGENPVERMIEGIKAMIPNWMLKALGIKPTEKLPEEIKITKQGQKILANYKAKCTTGAYSTLLYAAGNDPGKMDETWKVLIANNAIVPTPADFPRKEFMTPGEFTKVTPKPKTTGSKYAIHADAHVSAIKRYIVAKEAGDTHGMDSEAKIMDLHLPGVKPDEQVRAFKSMGKNVALLDPNKKAKSVYQATRTPESQMAQNKAAMALMEKEEADRPKSIWEQRKLDIASGKRKSFWGGLKDKFSRKQPEPKSTAGVSPILTGSNRAVGAPSTTDVGMGLGEIPEYFQGDWVAKTDAKIIEKGKELVRLVWPGDNRITSPFGPRIVKHGSSDHKGVDISGTKARAAAAGKVVQFLNKWGGIVVDHGKGFVTRYLHLNSFDVKKGDEVEAGQTLGTIGNKAPFPMSKHLHFETKYNGQNIDPELLYHNQTKGFKPTYASDIVKARQLSAKLQNREVDISELKEEAIAGGPFTDKYNPMELKDEFLRLVERSKQRVKETVSEAFGDKELAKQSAPVVVPVPVPAEAPTNVDNRKDYSKVDSDLDNFVSNLFTDTSLSFTQKYKGYVYDSNVGHAFI